MKIKLRSSRGFSLVTALLIAMVVSLLMMAMFGLVLPSVQAVSMTKRSVALRCSAESALDYAINRITAGDQTFLPEAGGSTKVSIPTNISGYYGGMAPAVNCTVANIACPPSSSLYNSLLDPTQNAGVTGNGWLVVTSQSETANYRGRIRAILKPVYTTTSAAPRPYNLDPAALSLRGDYNGDGSPRVDSYNSKTDPNGKTNLHNGDVQSDGIINTKGGPSLIDGDAAVTDENKADSKANISGQWKSHQGLEIPPPPPPPVTAKSISPITKSVTMTAGDYVISTDTTAIDLQGTKQITISSGPVRLWVTGEAPQINMNGKALANTTLNPANFQIFYVPTNENKALFNTNGTTRYAVDVGGTSDFHGVIYAPQANLNLRGTGGFFGAMVGNSAWLHGTGDFHYDENLAGLNLFNYTPPNGGTQYTRAQCASWEELD